MSKNYTVKSPVRHDGKLYEVGNTIVLEREEAAALLRVSAVVEAPLEKSTQAPKQLPVLEEKPQEVEQPKTTRQATSKKSETPEQKPGVSESKQ